MARTTKTGPHKAWLTTLAVASLLLSGCAASAAETPQPAGAESPAAATPAPSHTMPDGTVMAGAEHGMSEDEHEGHDSEATDAREPSDAAAMICSGQVVTSAVSILGIDGTATPSSTWDAPMYTCTYDVDGAPVVLTVHDTTDPAAGEAHFDELQASLGAHEIEGLLDLGLPSFSTGDGVVGFLRDGKTLLVDATALPDGFGDGSRNQDGAAYAMASAVLVCWTHHD